MPELAVTVIVLVPVAAVDAAVRVSVEVALPFCGGVTDAGANDAETPLGSPATLRFTGALNAPTLPTVIESVPLAPCTTVSDDGAAATEKSAAALPHTSVIGVALAALTSAPTPYMSSSVRSTL